MKIFGNTEICLHTKHSRRFGKKKLFFYYFESKKNWKNIEIKISRFKFKNKIYALIISH